MNESQVFVPRNSVAAVEAMLAPVTVPIAVDYKGRVGHHATALLFECGDYRFLVTARHAVLDAVEHDAAILIPSDLKAGKAIRLAEKFFASRESGLDVAILKVPSEIQEHLRSHRWTHLSDFVASRARPGLFCATFGMLSVESDTWNAAGPNGTVSLRSAVFFATITDLDEAPEGWNTKIHVAAEANLLWATHADGRPRDPPRSLAGLSGAPVAVFAADPFAAGFSPLPLRIIGLQSSIVALNDANNTRVAKIVFWPAMFSLIASVFPSVWTIGRAYGLRR